MEARVGIKRPSGHARRGQSAFEYLLLIGGGVLFVILAVATVRSAINTNQNSANSTAGGYQNFLGDKSGIQLYSEYYPAIKHSCVAAWNFNEGTGTSAVDLKGNLANNGTLTNGPTWTTGIASNAILFDGSNDYVNVSQTQTFNLTNYTVSAWVNTRSTAGYQQVSDDSAFGGAGYTLRIQQESNGGVMRCFTINATNPSSVYHDALSTFNFSLHLNEWHHVACTFDGTTTRLYVDGALNASDNAPTITMATPPYPVRIGIRADLTAFPVNGSIDEVGVYNRVLSAPEITALYQAQNTMCN